MYGGGLWHTWFDRELTLSGLAIIRTPSGQMEKKLVTLDRPVGSIPNLCVHLGVDELKDGFKPRKEDHMNMILGRSKTSDPKKEYPTSLIGKHPQELLLLIAQHLNVQAADIVDLDLCFSTYQNANVGGINDEYIYSGRLDNLTTCYTALKALTSADFSANKTACSGIILYDHEEVGNTSSTGACSAITEMALRRISKSSENIFAYEQSMSQSFLLSCDMAHGLHPNYAEKHATNFKPNLGDALKYSVMQNFSSTALGSTLVRQICESADLPLVEMSAHQDQRCGQTLGPKVSANLGILVADIGVSQLAMHSCREMMAAKDVLHLSTFFLSYFNNFAALLRKHK
ncbi:unnamed protein product [Oikopleura dioica]|uniref:aspartyl aminopeptidase n=1 Tax=Oikopleura dioica TaxID=34765 RepID=E4YKR3_OIKDI|nr:unnamed protein product [Oikopleura dioica]